VTPRGLLLLIAVGDSSLVITDLKDPEETVFRISWIFKNRKLICPHDPRWYADSFQGLLIDNPSPSLYF
jgi:hypothetical protein